MSGATDVLIRIDEIEDELRGLSDEVHELRALVTRTAAAPAEPAPPAAVPTPEPVEPLAPITPPPPMWPPRLYSPETPAGPHVPMVPPAPSTPPKAPRTRRTAAQLAQDWDLLGPRGFAIIGGAVTAFGIVLLFVLAANRGWITPTMRVAFGACVSAAVIGVAFWVRSRYGQLQMSLGAAGAGIAGGYATLAAAAARYDIVPDWLALPLAGGLAALAVVIAIAWSSETVASIGLLGAALAPALQAIDTGMTWAAVAFAVIILAATVVLAVPRRWNALLIGISAVVGAQVALLALDSDARAGAGITAVVASFVLVVLAAGIWRQLIAATTDLDPLASSFVLAAVGLALLLVRPLWSVDHNQGIALAAAALVWAGAWIGLRRAQPSLALVLGISSLSLAAVATADMLSGTSLALTWAAEALLLSWIAARARDARLQATALVYCAVTAAHVLLVDAPPKLVFEQPVAGIGAASVAALAFALLGTGLLAPAEAMVRTETGLLAWLAPVRAWLVAHRTGLQGALVFGAAAAGTYALAILFIAHSFRSGHLAATIVAATVGASAVAISARRGSVELVAASLAWVGGVFVIAAGFDVPEFWVDGIDRSYGGWALIAASAGVLAGCYAFQLLFPSLRNTAVPAGGGVLALAGSMSGIALISPAGDVLESTWIGWWLLVPTIVCFALSAAVFRIPRHRDLATIMWALGTIGLLASEWLVVRDATWRAVAYAVTAAVLALLSNLLREQRLWFAGAAVAGWTGSSPSSPSPPCGRSTGRSLPATRSPALRRRPPLSCSALSPGATRSFGTSSRSPGRPRSSC